MTGHPLQIYPSRQREEFDSDDDYWEYQDGVARWNSFLPPKRPIPTPERIAPGVADTVPPSPGRRRRSLRSRHVGVRLTEKDFELLSQLANAHAVSTGAMARMLIVRGVRAAADRAD